MTAAVATAEPAEPAEPTAPEGVPDPLFGQAGAFSANWARHDGVLGRIRMRDLQRGLPKMIALCVKTCWRADHRGTLLVGFCQLAAGALTAFGLLAVNGVLRAVLTGATTPERIRAALPAVLLAGAAAATNKILTSVAEGEAYRLKPKVQTYAWDVLYEATNQVELASFERADFKNELEAAQYGSSWLPSVMGDLVGAVSGVMSLIAVGGVLAVLHPLLLALLPLIVIPGGLAAIRKTLHFYRSWQGMITVSRQQRQLGQLLVDSAAAEESRVHGVGTFILEHHRRLADQVVAEKARLGRIQTRGSLLAGAATGAATALAYVVMWLLLRDGAIALSAAGTAAYALRTATAQLTTLISRLTSLYETGLYVGDWDRACALARTLAIPAGGQPVQSAPRTIEARSVTFRYPDAATPALRGVNLTITAGQTVALVGENGSGKSTLARVLAGLYLAEDGEVFWDGQAVSALDRRQMFGHVALLAQNFKQWPFTFAANVHVGRPDTALDESAFTAAVDDAGAQFVYDLPDGVRTLLSKDYSNGTNLSGGQWQKTALARSGHYRDGDLVILDEPTSSLDPKAEIDVFNSVSTLLRGKTVLLLTHRLGSVKNADVIHVLHKGQIVESGTFDELLATGGRFAILYRLQADQYQSHTEEEAA